MGRNTLKRKDYSISEVLSSPSNSKRQLNRLFPLGHIYSVYDFGLWDSLCRNCSRPECMMYKGIYLCYLVKKKCFSSPGLSQRLVYIFPHGPATKHATLDSAFRSPRNYFRSERNSVSHRKKSRIRKK